MPAVQVTEVAEGLWRWTGWHDEWKQEVGCVYFETPEGVCLIDPLVPPEDTERFWAALDRDVERAGGGGVDVLVTVFWHTRHTREVIARYGGRVWAASRARTPVARRAGEVTNPFRPGDRLPGGIVALETGRGTEAAYYLPQHRTLVPGDVILGAKDGPGLRFCPESWLPSGSSHARLRQALRPVLDLDVERVLVSHGEPVLEGGGAELRRLIAA